MVLEGVDNLFGFHLFGLICFLLFCFFNAEDGSQGLTDAGQVLCC